MGKLMAFLSASYSSATEKMVDHLANTEINSQRIAAVESCFGASGQPLALPGRVLLGEGGADQRVPKEGQATHLLPLQ